MLTSTNIGGTNLMIGSTVATMGLGIRFKHIMSEIAPY